MIKLNLDALEVTSFETTPPQSRTSAVTGTMCDSPWCGLSIDRACFPGAGVAGY